MTGATCILTYLANEYVLKKHFEFPAMIPPILGTALAFFIGFNNNQAYDRWWEARIIWGALVNESRTWARLLIHYVKAENNASLLVRRMIYRHIAFLYLLKEALRGRKDEQLHKYLSAEEARELERHHNKHNALLQKQSADLNTLYQQGHIDGFKFMEMNQTITAFCNEMGKSERIRNTVFPTTYNYYTKTFIWIFIVSVTMVTSNLIGAWSMLFGSLVGYVFLTIHNMGFLLINPFEFIPTGIPLDQITRTIEINLLEMMEEKEVPDPIPTVNEEYVM